MALELVHWGPVYKEVQTEPSWNHCSLFCKDYLGHQFLPPCHLREFKIQKYWSVGQKFFGANEIDFLNSILWMGVYGVSAGG